MRNRIAVAFGACLLLSACGGHEEPPPSFTPPDYSYLPKLRLNVGTLSIEDHAAQAAAPNELGQDAPYSPDQALQRMAHDRLIAAGNSGAAVFTIDQASITDAGGGTLDGHMAVHLDIMTANGGHAGYAEAHVTRQFTPGSGEADNNRRAELYSLTQQMMQDMNVEFEYQVRRSLRDWLVDASGAPIAGSVEQQTLAPPGSAPVPGASSTGMPSGGATPLGAAPLAPQSGPASGPASGPVNLAPQPQSQPQQFEPQQAQPAAPSAVFPEGGSAPDNAAPTPQLRSPVPGFLQPPSGAQPNPPATTSGY